MRTCEPDGAGRYRVFLDRTAFYPESGGQPADRGTLGGNPVWDLGETEDGAVFHVLDVPVEPGAALVGEVDRARRFDHMQQHSGQHVLSAAFWALGRFKTVGFHLGADDVTVDLHPPAIRPEQVEQAFRDANAVIWEDRPVRVSFHDSEQAGSLALRKPTARTGTVRVVEVEGFDRSACGGTHVSRTGQIGVVVLLRTEKLKDKLRIHFLCGARAAERFQTEHAVLSDLCTLTTTGVPGLVDRTKALLDSLRELEKERNALEAERLKASLPGLIAAAERVAGAALLLRVFDGDSAPAGSLCKAALASGDGVVAVAGARGSGTVFFGRSGGVDLDMTRLAAHLRERFGARGGGRADMAQVGGLAAAEVDEAVAACRRWVGEMLGG